MSTAFVCLMGIGTVFFGLICLVFICYLVSKLCKLIESKKKIPQKDTKNPDNEGGQIPQEVKVAAVAAISEQIGQDAKNIKITSFKRA